MTDKNVKVYSTPSCPWCKKAKDYLITKGVQFTDIDVAVNRDKLQEMVQLTGQRGVPVIVVDGETIVGFNQEKIDQALEA